MSICNKQDIQKIGERQRKKHTIPAREFLQELKKKRHKVLAGTVERRYQHHTCLVKYKLLNSDDSTKPKFRIEDIFDFPKDKDVNVKKTKRTRKGKLIKRVCVFLRPEMI